MWHILKQCQKYIKTQLTLEFCPKDLISLPVPCWTWLCSYSNKITDICFNFFIRDREFCCWIFSLGFSIIFGGWSQWQICEILKSALDKYLTHLSMVQFFLGGGGFSGNNFQLLKLKVHLKKCFLICKNWFLRR